MKLSSEAHRDWDRCHDRSCGWNFLFGRRRRRSHCARPCHCNSTQRSLGTSLTCTRGHDHGTRVSAQNHQSRDAPIPRLCQQLAPMHGRPWVEAQHWARRSSDTRDKLASSVASRLSLHCV
uniref:Uncharacterized protein n=1 Tax=Noctiluca scintillans TaxID=2966 RepID=A7WQA6_NOCSC|nr:unknown [Noctiluca scintillans]